MKTAVINSKYYKNILIGIAKSIMMRMLDLGYPKSKIDCFTVNLDENSIFIDTYFLPKTSDELIYQYEVQFEPFGSAAPGLIRLRFKLNPARN